MYDDFWAGYNFGNNQVKGPIPVSQKMETYRHVQQNPISSSKPGTYNKTKFIRMQGPNGEIGDIFANGKMYIVLGPNKGQVRTFGSRPYAIKYMQSKGWVLV